MCMSVFFFKQKTAYESRISDWSSDVCSSDLQRLRHVLHDPGGAAAPQKKGAAVVNCTSITMYQGSKQLLDYSSTKGAITAFTRSLSENLIEDGIRVNEIGRA